jgi:hypothetical protein
MCARYSVHRLFRSTESQNFLFCSDVLLARIFSRVLSLYGTSKMLLQVFKPGRMRFVMSSSGLNKTCSFLAS